MEKKPAVQRLLIMAGILTLTLGAFFAGGIALSSAHAQSQGDPGKPGTPGPANAVKGAVTVKSVAGNTIKATVLELPNLPKDSAVTITTTTSTTYEPDKSVVAPGKSIYVVGTVNQDGSITANQIGVFDATSGSLDGTITNIAGSTIIVQTKDQQGNDQTFTIRVTASTTFTKVDLQTPATKSSQPASFNDLAVGEAIEADGTWNSDGTLTASHVVIVPSGGGDGGTK